jgi:hypothetical protein
MWAVKILLFAVLFIVGLLMMIYSEPLTRFFGKAAWAEYRMSTMGGTYFLWKIVGLVFIILGFLFLVGTLNFLFV